MSLDVVGSCLSVINTLDQHIQFTKEEARPDGSMPFLDVLITPGKMAAWKLLCIANLPTFHTITVLDILYHYNEGDVG